jgi:hypothetical protein
MTMYDAIAISVREGRIVHVGFDDVDGGALLTAFAAECDDSVVSGDETEYWGTEDEGAEWRVHVQHTDGAVDFS